MYQHNFPGNLPSADELPDSCEIAAHNELQELIPGLLKATLLIVWAQRMDWFLGIDMGVYYHPDKPAIVPDAFLSLGVERCYHEDLRPSYVFWEDRVPSFVLEVTSSLYRKEFGDQFHHYESLGILYYAIYASLRLSKPRLEVHKLVNGKYKLQSENPVWMPEIGLGIGYERGNYAGVTREWVYWYDEEGNRYLTPEEQVKQESQRAQIAIQRAEQESQQSEKFAKKLRELGIDPNTL